MSVRLVCVDRVRTFDETRLDHLPITLGRGAEADVRVHDTWASRLHCCLFEQHGQLWIRDLCSSNGTRLNGQAIEEAAVHSGDQVTIGITTLSVLFLKVPHRRGEAALQPL